MTAALVLITLMAPAPKKHWSKAHLVAVWAPNTWTVQPGKGDRVFVMNGPELPRGRAIAVLRTAGAAGNTTLEKKTDDLANTVRKKPGWRVVAKQRKTLGHYAAYRIGIAFNDDGRKGRARFTVVLAGGFFYILTMNAPASGFPASTFDAIEKSLEIPWSDHKLKAGVTLQVPRGWTFDDEGPGAVMSGPPCGIGPAVVRLGAGRMPAEMLAKAKPGPKLVFLGAARETQLIEREVEGFKLRMLHVHHDGLTATAMVPAPLWDDMLATVSGILASVKPPKPDGEK